MTIDLIRIITRVPGWILGLRTKKEKAISVLSVCLLVCVREDSAGPARKRARGRGTRFAQQISRAREFYVARRLVVHCCEKIGGTCNDGRASEREFIPRVAACDGYRLLRVQAVSRRMLATGEPASDFFLANELRRNMLSAFYCLIIWESRSLLTVSRVAARLRDCQRSIFNDS